MFADNFEQAVVIVFGERFIALIVLAYVPPANHEFIHALMLTLSPMHSLELTDFNQILLRTVSDPICCQGEVWWDCNAANYETQL